MFMFFLGFFLGTYVGTNYNCKPMILKFEDIVTNKLGCKKRESSKENIPISGNQGSLPSFVSTFFKS